MVRHWQVWQRMPSAVVASASEEAPRWALATGWVVGNSPDRVTGQELVQATGQELVQVTGQELVRVTGQELVRVTGQELVQVTDHGPGRAM